MDSRSLRSAACLALLIGCAHSAESTRGASQGVEQSEVRTSEEASSESFAELVRSLPRLEAATAANAGAGCLLAQDQGERPRLVAELAPAVTPMPEPSLEAIESLRDASIARLMSRYGIDGDLGPSIATFTRHRPAPDGFAIFVVVEQDTVFLRSTRLDGPRADAQNLERVTERLQQEAHRDPLVVVTAAPSVELRRLLRVLEALNSLSTPFALGVAFDLAGPIEMESAPRAPRSSGDEGRCASLPLADQSAAHGAIEQSAIRQSLRSLEASFVACTQSGDPRAVASGGLLRIALRIDAEGSAIARCVLKDELGEERVRACILREIERHRWPLPNPRGVVDVVFPLMIRPSLEGDHRAICEE